MTNFEKTVIEQPELVKKWIARYLGVEKNDEGVESAFECDLEKCEKCIFHPNRGKCVEKMLEWLDKECPTPKTNKVEKFSVAMPERLKERYSEEKAGLEAEITGLKTKIKEMETELGRNEDPDVTEKSAYRTRKKAVSANDARVERVKNKAKNIIMKIIDTALDC